MTTRSPSLSRPHAIAAAIGVAGAATALINHILARSAESETPPVGHFIEVDGVRVHYIERGHGEPLVLLHGNGMMIQDFLSSDLVAEASKRYRVIVFDRPGFGYSERPRSTIWTPDAQATLLHAALARLGVPRYLVLGHSWGASVAIALGLKYPDAVRGLVLEGGYYYPSVRGDVVLASGPAVPVLGDILRYTVSPVAARLMWPMLLGKLFGPAPVAPTFSGFPAAMAWRPSQLRASAAEAALMVPDAMAAHEHYDELAMPVALVAGTGDRIVDIDDQPRRFARENPRSRLHVVEGCGHMIHHTAPERVLSAIDEVAQAA